MSKSASLDVNNPRARLANQVGFVTMRLLAIGHGAFPSGRVLIANSLFTVRQSTSLFAGTFEKSVAEMRRMVLFAIKKGVAEASKPVLAQQRGCVGRFPLPGASGSSSDGSLHPATAGASSHQVAHAQHAFRLPHRSPARTAWRVVVVATITAVVVTTTATAVVTAIVPTSSTFAYTAALAAATTAFATSADTATTAIAATTSKTCSDTTTTTTTTPTSTATSATYGTNRVAPRTPTRIVRAVTTTATTATVHSTAVTARSIDRGKVRGRARLSHLFLAVSGEVRVVLGVL